MIKSSNLTVVNKSFSFSLHKQGKSHGKMSKKTNIYSFQFSSRSNRNVSKDTVSTFYNGTTIFTSLIGLV